MTRVVLDTNVVVSAFMKPEGNEAAVLRLALAGEFELVLSKPILIEYETVLRRPKFERMLDPNDVRAGIRAIRNAAGFADSNRTITVCRDDADNRFLECAETSRADYLVTGNLRHFPREWKTTKVINARALLGLIT